MRLFYIMVSYDDAPREIKNFMTYLVTIRGRSKLTANEYFLDLRNFFRFIIKFRKLVPESTDFNSISIDCVDLDFIKSITANDIYDYQLFMAQKRPTHQNSSQTGFGIENKSISRKLSALRSFYRYLTEKAYLVEYNPTANIESIRSKKTLPKFLTLNESINLLNNVNGSHKERDLCMIILFLNCGLRVSELVNMNLSDVNDEFIRVLGKGNKERIVYLNEACKSAIDDYLPHRITPNSSAENALFISQKGNRINVQTVKWLVKKHLESAGLGGKKMSVHKLRHTAATLMYQNGVDVRALQEVLGHENLDTTKIYTHISSDNLKSAAEKNPLSHIKIDKKNTDKNEPQK